MIAHSDIREYTRRTDRFNANRMTSNPANIYVNSWHVTMIFWTFNLSQWKQYQRPLRIAPSGSMEVRKPSLSNRVSVCYSSSCRPFCTPCQRMKTLLTFHQDLLWHSLPMSPPFSLFLYHHPSVVFTCLSQKTQQLQTYELPPLGLLRSDRVSIEPCSQSQ